MMKIIRQLSPEITSRLVNYINTHLRPLAKAEQAKCARGRQQLWLQAEPNYRTKKYMKAHSDPKLWAFCKRIFPKTNLAQIYFADGHIGISWHRDAAYAQPDARIINLGNVCLETKFANGETSGLKLTGGEIIQFNSKLLHRAIPGDEARIGIGLWAAKIDINDAQNWQ
jgi:hypothetical protein